MFQFHRLEKGIIRSPVESCLFLHKISIDGGKDEWKSNCNEEEMVRSLVCKGFHTLIGGIAQHEQCCSLLSLQATLHARTHQAFTKVSYHLPCTFHARRMKLWPGFVLITAQLIGACLQTQTTQHHKKTLQQSTVSKAQ
jgi:hypothetical protein